MGIIRRQSTYSAIILYSGILIGFLGTAIIRPKILSPSEIGFLQIVLNITTLFGGALTLGANLVTIKFLPKFKTDDHKNRGLLSLVVMFGLAGCMLGIPIILLAEPYFFTNQEGARFEEIEYNSVFYALLIFTVCIRTFYNILDNYLRAYLVSVPGVFSDNIILKTLPILALGFFSVGWLDFTQVIYFNLLIYSIPLLISWLFLRKLKVLKWQKPEALAREDKREIFGIATVGFVEIISYFIVLFIDVFMLKRFMNDEAVGIYTTMFYFGAVVSIPLRALVRIAHPIVSEALAKQDFGKVQEIYTKSSNILFLLGSFVFLLVWSNRYSIENFLDPVYSSGIWVIFFIGLAHLTEVASSINYQIIAVTPYYRFNLFMGILSIVLLVVTNYIFIQIFGLVGVAIGSLISLVLVNIGRHLFLWKRYQLNPFSLRTLKITGLFLVFFSLFEILPNFENIYWNAVFRSSVLGVTFLPTAYFLRCSSDFNDIVNKYLTKFNLPTPS